MDPFTTSLAVGAGSQLVGGIIGASKEEEARQRAMALIQQSLNDLNAIGVPPEEAQRITLQKFKSAGMLTPELEQNILQGGTELAGIETDPRLADYEMQALDQLRTIGQGGFSIQDKAALDKALSESARQEKGQRDAILQDAAQRGATTSGGTLAAQLLNQQGGATRANEAALATADAGYQRALDAIRTGGALAGDVQGRQFGQKAQVASAQDVINAMNTQAMQGVQQRNVGSMNAAQQYNLGTQQSLMNQNVGLENQQEMYNKSLPQQTFQNQLSLAGAKSNVRSGQAANETQGGRAQAQLWGNAGAGIGKIGIGAAGYSADDEYRQKQQNNQNWWG